MNAAAVQMANWNWQQMSECKPMFEKIRIKRLEEARNCPRALSDIRAQFFSYFSSDGFVAVIRLAVAAPVLGRAGDTEQ